MIHIFIGTKAQYVKVSPIIRELERRKIKFNLIDSGQHARLQAEFRSFLGIRTPDLLMREGQGDITNPVILMLWFAHEYLKSLLFVKETKKRLFKNKSGLCLVHGDTPTTLLSTLIAKRCGLKVAHLEAGLRSYSFFSPFPEEMIRIIVMKLSDLLFVSSQWAYDNLKNMKVKGQIITIAANTGLDALKYSLEKSSLENNSHDNYCLVSIHRFERLFSRKKIKAVVDMVKQISMNRLLFFPLHPPTKAFLARYNLLPVIQRNKNIICSELYSHGKFLQLIKKADFVITDGGSVQEESYYLGIPCLILRSHTERQEGLGQNAVIADDNEEVINCFLKNYKAYRRDSVVGLEASPSGEIVDFLTQTKEYLDEN